MVSTGDSHRDCKCYYGLCTFIVEGSAWFQLEVSKTEDGFLPSIQVHGCLNDRHKSLGLVENCCQGTGVHWVVAGDTDRAMEQFFLHLSVRQVGPDQGVAIPSKVLSPCPLPMISMANWWWLAPHRAQRWADCSSAQRFRQPSLNYSSWRQNETDLPFQGWKLSKAHFSPDVIWLPMIKIWSLPSRNFWTGEHIKGRCWAREVEEHLYTVPHQAFSHFTVRASILLFDL